MFITLINDSILIDFALIYRLCSASESLSTNENSNET